MIRLRLSTPNGRTNLTVDPSKTPKQILDENDVVLDNATVNLDGIPLGVKDMNTSFAELGCGESATLSVVVKTGNAA